MKKHHMIRSFRTLILMCICALLVFSPLWTASYQVTSVQNTKDITQVLNKMDLTSNINQLQQMSTGSDPLPSVGDVDGNVLSLINTIMNSILEVDNSSYDNVGTLQTDIRSDVNGYVLNKVGALVTSIINEGTTYTYAPETYVDAGMIDNEALKSAITADIVAAKGITIVSKTEAQWNTQFRGKAAWSTVAATAFESGAGTESDPYMIATPEQMAYFGAYLTASTTANEYFKLSAPIDLDGYTWTPINATIAFNFDGNNQPITNLYTTGRQYAGLFGNLSLTDVEQVATISNTILASGFISATSSEIAYAGGLVGRCSGTLEIINAINLSEVIATGTGSRGDSCAGGLVGCGSGTLTIMNGINLGNVTAKRVEFLWAGGLVGYGPGMLTMENGINLGTITAIYAYYSGYGGGLVGYGPGMLTMENGINLGTITATGSNSYGYSGGLMGYQDPAKTLTMENGINIGTVSGVGGRNGNGNAGGLVGYGGIMTNVINLGDISAESMGNDHARAGGLVGYGGIITNGINLGDVKQGINYSNSANVGGLVGFGAGPSITNGINLGSVSGSFVGGLVGYQSSRRITITNGINLGTITATLSGSAHAGGFVGYGTSSVMITITNGINLGTVTATSSNDQSYAGGLVGYDSGLITITNGINLGMVSGSSYAGGLVGYDSVRITITNGVNLGMVSGGSYAGGLVGFGTGPITMTNGVNLGEVNGYSYVGGLSGIISLGTISNSTNLGKADGSVAGGLVGIVQISDNRTVTIINNKNIGSVNGVTTAGAFVGSFDTTATTNGLNMQNNINLNRVTQNEVVVPYILGAVNIPSGIEELLPIRYIGSEAGIVSGVMTIVNNYTVVDCTQTMVDTTSLNYIDTSYSIFKGVGENLTYKTSGYIQDVDSTDITASGNNVGLLTITEGNSVANPSALLLKCMGGVRNNLILTGTELLEHDNTKLVNIYDEERDNTIVTNIDTSLYNEWDLTLGLSPSSYLGDYKFITYLIDGEEYERQVILPGSSIKILEFPFVKYYHIPTEWPLVENEETTYVPGFSLAYNEAPSNEFTLQVPAYTAIEYNIAFGDTGATVGAKDRAGASLTSINVLSTGYLSAQKATDIFVGFQVHNPQDDSWISLGYTSEEENDEFRLDFSALNWGAIIDSYYNMETNQILLKANYVVDTNARSLQITVDASNNYGTLLLNGTTTGNIASFNVENGSINQIIAQPSNAYCEFLKFVVDEIEYNINDTNVRDMGNGNVRLSLTISADSSVVAHFVQKEYAISAVSTNMRGISTTENYITNTFGNGTINVGDTISGISTNLSPDGYRFVGWQYYNGIDIPATAISGGVLSFELTEAIIDAYMGLNNTITLRAIYQEQSTLNLLNGIIPEGLNGSFSVVYLDAAGNEQTAENSATIAVDKDSIVRIDFTPDIGYVLGSVTGTNQNEKENNNSIFISMEQNRNISFEFNLLDLAVSNKNKDTNDRTIPTSVANNNVATIVYDEEGNVVTGNKFALGNSIGFSLPTNAQPTLYKFMGLKIFNKIDEIFEEIDIEENLDIDAEFISKYVSDGVVTTNAMYIKQYVINLYDYSNSTDLGNVVIKVNGTEVTGQTIFDLGDEIEIIASPNQYCEFSSFSGLSTGEVDENNVNKAQFTLSGNKNVGIVFEKTKYKLALDTGSLNGEITFVTQEFALGDDIVISFAPKGNNLIDEWKINGVAVTEMSNVKVVGDTVTIKATKEFLDTLNISVDKEIKLKTQIDTKPDKRLVIGLSVGGSALFIIIVLALIFGLRSRAIAKKRKESMRILAQIRARFNISDIIEDLQKGGQQ